MKGWRDSKVFRIALAFAMMLPMLFAPVGHSASHHPAALALAGFEHHNSMVSQAVDHVHGGWDGWRGERDGGHSHEHNPADHSHDVPAPVAFAGQPFLLVGSSWLERAPLSHDCGPPLGIERPPRP